MAPQPQQKWRAAIIGSVKTDLGFFSLVVLVLESFLGALALKSSGSQQNLLVGAFVFVLVLLIVVVGLKGFRENRRTYAEHLTENDSFAAGLGEEVHAALDGSLRNLREDERELAYELLRDGMKSSPHIRSDVQRHFSAVFVETIIRKAKVTGKWEARKNLPANRISDKVD